MNNLINSTDKSKQAMAIETNKQAAETDMLITELEDRLEFTPIKASNGKCINISC